jgi:hypothetical protein
MDKGGNFIGWLFVDNTNLSLALVEEGLAKVHFTAERSSFYKQMCEERFSDYFFKNINYHMFFVCKDNKNKLIGQP